MKKNPETILPHNASVISITTYTQLHNSSCFNNPKNTWKYMEYTLKHAIICISIKVDFIVMRS